MNIIIKTLLALALSIGSLFASLYILQKIFILTIHPIVGGPPLTMFQMFALTFFLGCAQVGAAIDGQDRGDKLTSNQKLDAGIVKSVARVLVLLLSWGLAALIF